MGCYKAIKKLHSDIKKWTWHHAAAFLLSFFLYATFHCSRKAFSNIKDRMGKSLSPAEGVYPYNLWQKEHMFENIDDANVFLGNLDLSFFLAYAIGLFVSGYICDRVNLKYMIAFGLFASAICTSLYGYFSVILNIRNQMFYLSFFFLNGIVQSTGRPAAVAITGNWFTKSSSGLVFGVWSCNGSIGNVMGSLIVASVVEYGYEYGILMVSIFSVCAGIVAVTCLVPHPNDIGLINPDQKNVKESEEIGSIPLPELQPKEASETSTVTSSAVKEGTTVAAESPITVEITKQKPIGFFEAVLIPGVIPYSLANACLKMVNYAFLFWLPTYLSQGLGIDDKQSDNLSNLYDAGGMMGGIAAGVISDFVGFRSPVLSVMLLLSLGSMYLYNAFGTTYISNILLMILTGFLLGGPANTISSTISADLGKHEKIKGSSAALGTVTGIVEGTGSVGAAIGQRYVAVIKKQLGWQWVFYFLIMFTGASIVLIIPILITELKALFRRRVVVKTEQA